MTKILNEIAITKIKIINQYKVFFQKLKMLEQESNEDIVQTIQNSISTWTISCFSLSNQYFTQEHLHSYKEANLANYAIFQVKSDQDTWPRFVSKTNVKTNS